MQTKPGYHILDRDHPYLAAMDLTHYEVVPGRWRVKWRDFLMMKQDCEFQTEQEAREFRDRVWLRAHLIDGDFLTDACIDFEHASEIWHGLG